VQDGRILAHGSPLRQEEEIVLCGKIFWQGEGDRHHLCDDQRYASVPAFGPLPGKWCLSPLPENLAAHK
jgi:hypothetical protein